jgi:phage terminase small subunit
MTDTTGKLSAKQEAFVRALLVCGNASEAYRQAYSCANMAPGSIHREASLLASNPKVTQRLAQLRAEAANKAVLDRSWVLVRLMKLAEVALGERTIKLRVPRKDKESGKTEVNEIEVSAHDGHVAARSLELLGKTQEVQLFLDKHEIPGKDGSSLIPDERIDKIDIARRIAHLLREVVGEAAAARMGEAAPADQPANDHLTKH